MFRLRALRSGFTCGWTIVESLSGAAGFCWHGVGGETNKNNKTKKTWEAMRRSGSRTAAREHVHLLVCVASVSPSVIAARSFPDGTPLELAAATNLGSVSMRSLLIRMVRDVVAQGLL